jgi:hypothetical protein
MMASFNEPVNISPGSVLMVEIGEITNPPSTGQLFFEVATLDSTGTVIDLGSASITINEPTILQDSVETEHIQDAAVTTRKIGDSSITLNKLASDVFFFFDDRISPLQEQISEQINGLRAEFEESIQSEESARLLADADESSARADEDEEMRAEINELREQINDLEEEVAELRSGS